MEAIGKASFIRCSPRKLRLVSLGIKKLPLPKAIVFLENSSRRSSLLLLKVVQQAQANAVNNLGLEAETLKIKKIEIGEGPVYKRWQAVSRGRAYEIQKKTSHIKVVLEGEEKGKKEMKKIEKGGKNGAKS